MPLFKKQIASKTIYVNIENALFEKEHFFFEAVFQGFNISQKESIVNNSNILFIHCNHEQKTSSQSNLVYCDTEDKYWKIRFLEEIEDWVEKNLNCTVLHGAGIIYLNKKILILGKSLSGKSTLTNHLCSQKNSQYLDDDSIYIINEKYYGLNLPQALRFIPNSNCSTVIANFYDYSDCMRNLVQINEKIDMLSSIDIIILPTFTNDSNNSYHMLTSGELLIQLINNIRVKVDMQQLMEDLSHLSKTASGYQIFYNSSKSAEEMIKTIIKNYSTR